MDSGTLTFTASANEPVLNICVKLNEQLVYQGVPGVEPLPIKCKFNDDDTCEYVLTIELSGKTIDHTKVDDQGNIIKDILITLSEFKLEDIDISQVIFKHAAYHHNFNGTQDKIVDSFHGTIGCNGQVIFKFQSPSYLWLLENM